MSMSLARRRVRRGANLLDQIADPNWIKLIDLQKLNIRSGHTCVLGQVYAEEAKKADPYLNGYGYAVDRANIVPNRAVESHGFLSEDEKTTDRELDEAWIEYLTYRREHADEFHSTPEGEPC